MLLAARVVTPNLAAPMRSANSSQVSYIAMDGRTTRGNAIMSLCTAMLRSISFRAIVSPPSVLSFRISFVCCGSLCCGEAAVEVQRLSGDEFRGRCDEEEDSVEHVVGRAYSA